MNKYSNGGRLIALDWGTSSLRAYLLGDRGTMLEEISLSLGIMQLQQAASSPLDNRDKKSEAFENALQQACGKWLDAIPELPILTSGMVGSAQGWREAPYLDIPTELSELGNHLTQLKTQNGNLVYIVPGLIRREGLVNVIRGEETQVLGVLASLGSASNISELIIGLPGTHSKWVHVKNGVIEDFETFMTGEVYAALCEHTILGRTMQRGDSFFPAAFERGVLVAMSSAGEMGVLSNIFSARTLGLTKQLTPAEQPDYLSGLLIGHEMNAVSKLHSELRSTSEAATPILLVGQSSLCARYQRALELHHCNNVTVVADAAVRGLWQIAVQANLV